MPKPAWMRSIALLAMLSPIACATETSRTIVKAPPIIIYADEVQARAAEELAGLGPPCLASELTPGCSALRTFVNDYAWTRDKIRALVP